MRGVNCCACLVCRVRISLGLKPLVMESDKEQRQKEAMAREAKRAEEEKEAKAAELAERVKAYVRSYAACHASCHSDCLTAAEDLGHVESKSLYRASWSFLKSFFSLAFQSLSFPEHLC